MSLNEEKIIELLLKHEQDTREIKIDLEDKASKTDLDILRNMMDYMIGKMEKFDQELSAMNSNMVRVLDRLDAHENILNRHDKIIKRLNLS